MKNATIKTDQKPKQQGTGSESEDNGSVGSHKPGGDGPGTKKFKSEHDDGEKHNRKE